MNIKSNKKLKVAILATVLSLNFTNLATATPTQSEPVPISNIDLSKEFRIMVHYSGVGWSGSGKYSYLYYTPVDKTVPGNRWGYDHDTTFKAGVLYLITGVETGNADSDNHLEDDGAIALGNAQDIFGGGLSDDEIKDLIDDAIHNVQGDQTVNGSQDITGDQTVEGEQTVNGGQTVTGGFYFFNNKV